MCVCVCGGRLGGRLLVAAHLAAGVDVPLGVVVLADVHAEVAALLGAVGAVGALVAGRLAAALHVLVAAQRGLPAVALAAVAALELAAGVVVAAAQLVAGVQQLVGQHDVVRVVGLAVRRAVVRLHAVVVLQEGGLLQQVRLERVGEVGQGREGREGEEAGGRERGQRRRLRALRRQQR